MVLRFLMLLAFFVLSCSNYDRDNAFDSKGKNSQYETCGDWNYNPHPDKGEEQRCNEKNNIIERKCGSNWYKAADSTTFRCKNNVLETMCGSSWYDASNSTLRCKNNAIETKCGSDGWYDTTKSNFRCKNNVVETMCGSDWYNVGNANLNCQNNVVVKKCGNNWYDTTKTTLRCQNNMVETRCGSDWFNNYDANLRCQKSVIEKKCGSGWYNLSEENDTWSCQKNVPNKLCFDGKWFDGTTNYCSYSGVTPYENFSSNGKTYKTLTIDGQTWMAENLNYSSNDSKCYSNYETNCSTYGRLYDWFEARTVCPSGWRLPEDYELGNLMSYITDDDYSFAPLLGGSYTNSFSNKDKVGFWWSISPGDVTSAAYGQKVSFEGENYSIEDISLPKSNLLSVRCIKN
ncbi:MAG: hypothetical protein FWF63_08530 [Fibromonadales bacterium]|nr:hypothetical protein [Fibromonadales bacterium]